MTATPWIILTTLLVTQSSHGNSTAQTTEVSKKDCDEEILAVYKMTLQTKWNETTYPKGYPEDEAGWERPYGLVHNSEFFLYRIGEVSPYPVRNYTKNGNTDLLMKVGLENANVYDQFEGSQIEEGVGVSDAVFLVESEYSQVSVISRMIPSPDWFIGVDGFDLCLDATWIDSVVLALTPMDGGIVTAKSFHDDRWPTHPAEPVATLGMMVPPQPENPFYYPYRDLPEIATVTLTKLAEYSKVDLWKEVLSDIRIFHEEETDAPSKSNNTPVKKIIVKPKIMKIGNSINDKDPAEQTTVQDKNKVIELVPIQATIDDLLMEVDKYRSQANNEDKGRAAIIKSKLLDASIDISDLKDFLDENIEEVGLNVDIEGFDPFDSKVKPLDSDKIEVITAESKPDNESKMFENHLKDRIKEIDETVSQTKKKKKPRKKKSKTKRKSKINKRHKKPMDTNEIIIAVANGELRGSDTHLPRHFKHRLSEAVNRYTISPEYPIDCVVSDWSTWSSCEEPFNIGRRTRIRHVVIPPRNTGQPCPELIQEEVCFTDIDNDPHLGWFKF